MQIWLTWTRSIFRSTWVKHICRDLGESRRPWSWRLSFQTVGSGYWLSLGPERKRVLLAHPPEWWEVRKQHLKLQDPICGSDSSWEWAWPLLSGAYGSAWTLCQWSSGDRSQKGTRSYTSWPELLREMCFFLIASWTSFSAKPWRSPWYHSWSLTSWSNVSPWSASFRSLLIEVSLISKTPSLSDLITLTSNSDGACFPVILLCTCCWGWGSPRGGWTETWVELLGNSESLSEDDCGVAASAEEVSWSQWLWNETWRENKI